MRCKECPRKATREDGLCAWCADRALQPAAVKEVGLKLDDGKPRWDLMPPKAERLVVDVLTYGAKKYAPENWRKVEGWRWRYYRAALGHIKAWASGEKLDEESNLPHLAHAACCLLFLLELDV